MINELAVFLQATPIAAAIRQSTLLTGLLSGLHLVGMTLVGGSALITGLRATGAAFSDFPASDVTRVARRGIAIGVTISIVSGFLMFTARAPTAIGNGFFQVKMLLLAAALAFHFAIYRSIAARLDGTSGVMRLSVALGAALWFAVILAGCAYILLEG